MAFIRAFMIANIEDPDDMPHIEASHLCFHSSRIMSDFSDIMSD